MIFEVECSFLREDLRSSASIKCVNSVWKIVNLLCIVTKVWSCDGRFFNRLKITLPVKELSVYNYYVVRTKKCSFEDFFSFPPLERNEKEKSRERRQQIAKRGTGRISESAPRTCFVSPYGSFREPFLFSHWTKSWPSKTTFSTSFYDLS